MMRTLQLTVVAGLLACVGSVQAQCDLVWGAAEPSPFLTGTITNMVTWDPDGTGPLTARLVVGSTTGLTGGTFTGAYLAMFDGTDWTELPMADPVTRIGVVQGLLVVATAHTQWINPTTPVYYNNVHRRSLSGSSTICQQVRGTIDVIAEFNGEPVIGGRFNQRGIAFASPFRHVARIPASGAAVELGTGMSGPTPDTTVAALAVFNGRLVAGGNFTTAGGSAATHLATWNGTSWSPLGNPNGPVRALAVRNATTLNNTFLFAAGEFTAIGPLPMVGVARFNDASNSWAAMSLPGTTQARDLAVRGVGLTGYELHAVSTALSPFALQKWTSSGWTPIGNTNANLRLGYFGGQLHGGFVSFSTSPGTSVAYRRVGRVVGTAFESLAGRGIAGTVHAALPDGDDFVIGGDFQNISGTVTNGIARGRPGAWQPLGAGVDGGSVRALARMPNGDLVVGGDFTAAGGQPAAGLALWNGTGWSPFGGGGAVHALTVLANGDLMVGGSFASMGGTAAANVARWNGTSWSALDLGVGGGSTPTVHCFRELANGDLVAGGQFTTAGSITANRIARWNGSQWAAYGNGLLSTVRTVEPLASGELLASVGDSSLVSLVWGGVAWLPTYPSGFVTMLPDGGVAAAKAHLLDTGMLSVRNTPPDGTSTGFDTWSIEATTIGGVRVATNGDIAIYGDLWSHGPRHTTSPPEAPDTGCSGFVLLQPTCRAQVTSQPSGCTGATPLTFVARSLPWLGGVYRAQAIGFGPAAIAVEVIGFQPVALPLAAVFATAVPGCTLWAAPDVLSATLPIAGAVSVALSIPPTPSLVGVMLRNQLVELELTGAGFGAVRSSEALTLVLGSY